MSVVSNREKMIGKKNVTLQEGWKNSTQKSHEPQRLPEYDMYTNHYFH